MTPQDTVQREPESSSTLTEAGRLVSELESLLESESQLMQKGTPEDLLALAQRKSDILNGLALKEGHLLGLFASYPGDDRVSELKTRLQACRTLNEDNQQVALMELSHTRKSLELLRSMLKMNDVPMYGSTGHLTVNREKRNFGSA